jgi:hypothetical protein
MSDQLHHLLQMSMRSSVSLRVVPASLGAHAAMAGAFRLMEFAEFQPVAYLESTTSSLFLELPEEIAAYRDILAALAATALDEEQSSRPRTASCPGTRLQGPRRPRPGRPHLSLADVPHHRDLALSERSALTDSTTAVARRYDPLRLSVWRRIGAFTHRPKGRAWVTAKQLGPYRLGTLISSGAMGEVRYQARLRRHCAGNRH